MFTLPGKALINPPKPPKTQIPEPPPAPPQEPTAPVPDDLMMKKAKKRKIAQQQARSGSRLSTILTDSSEQTLG